MALFDVFKKRVKKEPQKKKKKKDLPEVKRAIGAEKKEEKKAPGKSKRPAAKEEEKEKEVSDTKKREGPISVLAEKRIKTAYRVLIRPVITEKATMGEGMGCYTFEVAPEVNKIMIKKAIKELYNIKPIKVNIIRVSGKMTRYGRSRGRTKNWKKAIVFLKQGQKIEFVKK